MLKPQEESIIFRQLFPYLTLEWDKIAWYWSDSTSNRVFTVFNITLPVRKVTIHFTMHVSLISQQELLACVFFGGETYSFSFLYCIALPDCVFIYRLRCCSHCFSNVCYFTLFYIDQFRRFPVAVDLTSQFNLKPWNCTSWQIRIGRLWMTISCSCARTLSVGVRDKCLLMNPRRLTNTRVD